MISCFVFTCYVNLISLRNKEQILLFCKTMLVTVSSLRRRQAKIALNVKTEANKFLLRITYK